MKKFLLTLLAAVGLSCTLSAEETKASWSFKVTQTNSPSTSTTLPYELTTTSTSSTGTWTLNDPKSTSVNAQGDQTKGPRFGTSKAPLNAGTTITLSDSPIPNGAIIKTVEFKVTGNAGTSGSTWKLSINGKEFVDSENQAKTVNFSGNSEGTGTWSDVNITGKNIVLTATSITAGFHLGEISVTYDVNADEPGDPDLSYETEVFNIFTFEAEAFEAPELNNPHNLTVSYSVETSEGTEAIIDENNGTLLLESNPGTVKVTASFDGNADYIAGSASYTVNIVEPKQCEAPTFTDTSIFTGRTVTITSATTGAIISYTIDGDEAIEAASPVVLTFNKGGEFEVTATAKKTGHPDSETVTETVIVTEGTPHVVTFDFVNNDFGMTRLSGQTSEYNTEDTRFGQEWIVATANHRTRLWSDGLRIYGPDKENNEYIEGTEGRVVFDAPDGATIVEVHIYHKTTDVTNDESHTDVLSIEANEAVIDATWQTSNHALSKVELTYYTTSEDHVDQFKASAAEHFVVKVNGVEQTSKSIALDPTEKSSVELSHAVYPHAAIFTKFVPKQAAAQAAGVYYDVIEGFEPHSEAYTLPGEGTLSYYAEVNGHQTAVQTVTVNDPTSTSINEVSTEEKAMYIDLQGRPVANPSKGIFLRSCGGKTTKIRL